MKIVKVRLKTSTYEIRIGSSLEHLGQALQRFRKSDRALVVTHASLKKWHGDRLKKSLATAGIRPEFHLLPEGESAKTLKTVEGIYRACLKGNLDRSSWMISLGGGVAGDVAGFAAATFLRGIPLAHVPTTLLAM